jgi:electron transport complex protein RnfC
MKAKTFSKGIHPAENKAVTASLALEVMAPPEKVFIPLHQHFGSPTAPLVKKGDEVFLGQKIGEAQTLFSASVHSSVSGKVLSVDGFNHPLGKPVLTVAIANDGQDRLSPEIKGEENPFSLKPAEIRQKVKDAGIVGLGGAAFPTSVKLSPPKDKPIDTIIINGCECEPVLTADHRVMLEFSEDIIKGAELVRIATGAQRIIIGIEDNKKDACGLFKEKMKKSLESFPLEKRDIKREILLLKTKYPQGAEKNLIQALLQREVPKGGLPFDVGVVVQNVGTAKAVWDACSQGLPLYERALTVSGTGIADPKNLMVRIGTTFQDVIDFCGGFKNGANILVMGGPMMGLAQWTPAVPVIKGTSGILAWETPSGIIERACIRCGRCVEHCPMNLVPTQLMKYVKYDHLKEAEDWGALDCVECGSCQYKCPAKIRLVHWIKLGKNKVMSMKRKKSA